MSVSRVFVCAGLACAMAAAVAAPLWAGALTDTLTGRMAAADIVLLGEVHDNPDHHVLQAEAVTALKPSAMVWEMLTAETAARIDAGWISDAGRLEQALKWGEAGWPSFEMYFPIFRAAAGLPVYGAQVPRQVARTVRRGGAAVAFGVDAGRYGLTVPLPKDEQAAREADQMAAHCNAIPDDLPPVLVAVQRLRDATLARAAIEAFDAEGGPVVVITGNGHARADRGVPAYLRKLRPGLRVFALGQSEDGQIDGRFDAVVDSPAAERPDPCLAFGKAD